MENLFLRVLTVSLAVSFLLAPLLLCRGRLEKRYAPQTRQWLWLVMALVLLLAPWLPKFAAPVVVEAPAYTVSLPARPAAGPQSPVNAPAQSGAKSPQEATAGGQVPVGAGQGQGIAPAQPGAQAQPAGPAQPQREAAQSGGLSLVLLAAGVWLGGMAAVLLWQGARYRLLRRRLLRQARLVSGLERYARELGLEGRVAFYECEGISGPMTLGVFRPLVLLPPQGLAPAALRHELYHIKRRDVGYKTLLLLACALHWFNPLVWRMARAADRDVEACCDAAVVAGQDADYRRSYGELLLSAAGTGRELPFTTSFGGGMEQMKSRLTQLFRPGKRSRALVCVLLAAAVLLSGLVACREAPEAESGLADGTYCALFSEVIWPLGEPDAEGEDYEHIKAILYRYDETGPSGPALGEHTLPLSENLMLRQSWWGEDQSAGERGTQAWQQAVADLLDWPMRRNAISLGTDYLVVEVENGQIVRLSWAMVSQEDEEGAGSETVQALTENTMPHLDFYDPQTQFLVYHTQTAIYFDYGAGETRQTFRCDQTWGGRVMDTVDVRYQDGAVWFSDCDAEGGQGGRYYRYDVENRAVEELDGPFDPGPEPLEPADPARIFDRGMYQPTHTYSLWSNALVCSDGTLAALAVNGLIEGGGTLDALEIVRMGETWWEENRLLTPEKLPAHADYVSPDWGFILHLPRSFEGQYLIQRDYNASGLPCWSFYHRDSYAGPSGSGFLFTLFAQDAETFRANGYEGDTVLKEQNGIVYTMTTLPYREDWFSGDYLELLEAAESITGEDLDLSGVIRSTGYLWPVPGTGQGQDVVLRMFGQDGLDGVSLLFPYGGWAQGVAAGTVSAVRKDPGSGFYTVSVDHGDGNETSYGHLSNVWATEGQRVLRGEALGPVGESGGQYSLAFAWNDNGQYINPVNDVEWRQWDFSELDPVALLYAGDQHIPAALRAVLLGEATFYNVETGEYCYADALPFSDDVPVKVSRFTEVDMDNDAIPEVVLWLERGGNESVMGSIILHYQNGWVYGYPMGYRSLELETLKADGTYSWSGGAFHWGWGRMDFAAGKTRDISWCEGSSGEDELYYVEQLPAAAAEFEAASAAQDAKGDAAWLELTQENIALVY